MRKHLTQRLFRRFVPFAAILPMAMVTLVAYLGATLWSIRVSFSNSRTMPTDTFVGFAQYVKLFDNDRWLLSIENIAVYTVLFILISMILKLK